MTLQSSPVRPQATKAGTCPHGMPLGACPICNGMAGGNSTTKRDIPRNAGEMTYNQCAAIGAMLKAQKAARQSAKLAQQNHEQALIDFQKNIANTHQTSFPEDRNREFPLRVYWQCIPSVLYWTSLPPCLTPEAGRM